MSCYQMTSRVDFSNQDSSPHNIQIVCVHVVMKACLCLITDEYVSESLSMCLCVSVSLSVGKSVCVSVSV